MVETDVKLLSQRISYSDFFSNVVWYSICSEFQFRK